MLEKIDSEHLLVVGLAGSEITEPERTLKKLRATFPAVQVQLLRADRIAGKEHLIFAARNALKAFRQNRNRSRSVAVEFLLYASCQHQITRAILTLGVTPKTKKVAVVGLTKKAGVYDRLAKVARSELGGSVNGDVIEIGSKKKFSELMRVYNVSHRELEASRLPGEGEESVLKRLIIEQSALLALES